MLPESLEFLFISLTAKVQCVTEGSTCRGSRNRASTRLWPSCNAFQFHGEQKRRGTCILRYRSFWEDVKADLLCICRSQSMYSAKLTVLFYFKSRVFSFVMHISHYEHSFDSWFPFKKYLLMGQLLNIASLVRALTKGWLKWINFKPAWRCGPHVEVHQAVRQNLELHLLPSPMNWSSRCWTLFFCQRIEPWTIFAWQKIFFTRLR